jgi:DNA-nicking Smr family endonuclease
VTKRGGEDDARAFEEAMRGARPLPTEARRKHALPPAPARGPVPRAPRARAPTSIDLETPFESTLLPTLLPNSTSNGFRLETRGEAGAETIEGRGSGVDARAFRALKSGDTAVEARLDLHGLSRERALAALERFVAGARADGRRAVLVIHGRGAHSGDARPVLKPLVWRWLAAAPAASAAVLAFASARPAQGGDGATLLLLRRAAKR